MIEWSCSIESYPVYSNVGTVLFHVYNNKRAGLITEDNEFVLAI